jgi:transposase
VGTRRCSARCWPPSGPLGQAADGRGPDRTRCSPTRPTPPAATAPSCAGSGITAVIPEPADQAAHRHRRGSRGGRPVGYDRTAYRRRNVIERAFNQLKAWRGIATRYDKHATVFHGAVVLASILLWLRH